MFSAETHSVKVGIIMIAWWDREGLKMRPISAQAMRTMLFHVQATHTMDFILQPGNIPFAIVLYVLSSNYMPRGPEVTLGLTEKGLNFLRRTVGYFVEDRERLSPKQRAALDTIWTRVSIQDTYPYHAHRKFRDCRARDVFESLHALHMHFDVLTQKWVEQTGEGS